MNETDTDPSLFNIWQQEVNQDFIERNFMLLPTEDLKQDVKLMQETLFLTCKKLKTTQMRCVLLKQKQTTIKFRQKKD